MQFTYTPRMRFSLIVFPIVLAIVVSAVTLSNLSTGTQGRALFNVGRQFGTLAAWGLGIALALAAVNAGIRRYAHLKNHLGAHGERLKTEYHQFLIRHKTMIIDIHLTIGIIGFLGALIHAYLLWQFQNVWLIIVMVLFGWVTLAGLLLKFGGIPPTARRYIYLLHAQWIIVVLLILVTIIGHAVIGPVRF